MSTTQRTPTEVETDLTELDCAGLLCPLPVYKAALALGKLQPGDRLRLTTTDPGALQDIPAMTRQRGDTLISVDSTAGHQTFIIEKGDQQ